MQEGVDGIPAAKPLSVHAVEEALIRAGLVFLDGQYTGDGGWGVRFSEKRPALIGLAVVRKPQDFRISVNSGRLRWK
jgi:hypothetical protein